MNTIPTLLRMRVIYNIASDISTRKIVWIAQQYQTTHSCVEVSAINRRAS